jgi:predicted proteasome-type protease
MSKTISVSEETVTDILKRILILIEETNILLNQSNRSVMSAEIQGWNDINYIQFKDMYDTAERQVKEGIKEFDEVLVPELKKIISSIEEF